MRTIQFHLDPVQQELLDVRGQRRFVMRCSEERLHEQAEEAYSLGEMRALVKKYGLCDMCDFSGLNVSAAKILINCAVTALYRYPCLRGKMCYLGSRGGYVRMLRRLSEHDADTLRALGVQHICDDALARSLGQTVGELVAEREEGDGSNILAEAISCMGLVDGILLDEADFSTQRFLQVKEELASSVRAKHSPIGCASVSAVIYHEIGHLLDYLCGTSKDPAFAVRFEEMGKNRITMALSRYASTSAAEFVAEGFSEYMSNPSPRKTACMIAEAIDRGYRAVEKNR